MTVVFRSLTTAERQKIDEFIVEQYEGGVRNAQELEAAVLKEFDVQRSFKAISEWLWRQHGKRATTGRSTVTPLDPVTSPDFVTVDGFGPLAQRFLAQHSPLASPPDRVLTSRLEEMGFDTEQEAVALFSDLHYYSRIDRRASNGLAEYNIDIARERFTRWRDGLLRFTQMSQLTMDLNVLHIFALGDDFEGHGKMFSSQALQMSESSVFQILGFVEDTTQIILSLLARYKKIVIYKVPGNHGRMEAHAKGAYGPDNFETIAWQTIGERIRAATGGEWTYSENGVNSLTGGQVDLHIHIGFFAAVDILGHLCLARHGHGLKGLQSTYTGAIDNKLRMNSIFGRIINYMFKAHLHEAQSAEHEIRGEVIQNGCFVGPSLLSLEMGRAAANLPSQEFFLFHPRHGKTHHYRIHLADVDEVRQLEIIGQRPQDSY